MIALLITVGLAALALLIHNVFLSAQASDLIRQRDDAFESLREFARSDSVVTFDLVVERARQIRNGWTPERDDQQSTHRMVELADERIHSPRRGAPYTRAGLLQGAAILVAAIESMDRRTAAQVAFRKRGQR